jgi:signal transduction histidine kinase
VGPRAKVLYVDVEPSLAAFHRSFAADFDVSTATIEDATHLLANREFAVVIAERSELLAEARSTQPDVVTMMVTAHASFETAVEAINQGRVVRYMRKPWSPTEMIQAIHDGVKLFEKRRENRLLRDRLISDERNAAIGQVASGLVHDLANIGAVLAVVDTVRDDWDKGIDLSEELSTLRSGVDKYWALVGSLKFCGTSQHEVQLDRKLCDLRRIMSDAYALAIHFPAVHGLAKFEIEPGPEVKAVVDERALFHALLNLLKNGAEACGSENGEVRTRVAESGGEVRIEVQDNGPGIPDELAPKVFGGFYSSKGSSGTGLGLLVTRRIIEAHGGKLEYRNLPGRGCIFSITLPARS